MPPKERLDTLLVHQGFFDCAEDAARAVLAHEVKVGDEYATSAAQRVSIDVAISVNARAPYVSRGGVKLRAALDAFAIEVVDKRCIDVGCSTGGFTDCLLQAGAREVVAVDVGYGDLAWRVRCDERVRVFERTNIRLVDPVQLGAPFDLIVTDVSFISLAGLAPVLAALGACGTAFVGLVKPQFESARGETDARGLVASEDVRTRTVHEVGSALEAAGFEVQGVIESPIHGKKSGNVEYLVAATLH